MFMSKQLYMSCWTYIAHSKDLQELQLRYHRPGEAECRTLKIFNIYNERRIYRSTVRP